MAASDSSMPVAVVSPGEPGAERRLSTGHEDLRELLQAFARTASSAFNLPAGLAILCHSAARLFAATRVSAWLHDRRARELVLSASSDPAGSAEGARIRADSDLLPAIALRREQPLRLDAAPGVSPGVIALPLRGRRRALGVLVFEGLAPEIDPPLLVELDDLARQLSASIDNLLLLEDVLRARRELARTFDSLEDLVAVCDAQLRVVHVNRTLADRLGHSHDPVFDRPLADLVGQEAQAWLASVRVGAAPAHSPATYARELEDEVLGGRFTMTVTPVPGADSIVGGAVFVARDITAQARLEAERAALRERLSQAEKLAALGQFVAGIAHEIRGPLEAVVGEVDALLRQKTTPAAVRTRLEAVARGAGRAAHSVENLLVFAGGQRVPRRAVSLNTVVARAIGQCAHECRTGHVEVARSLAAGLPPVLGHAPLMQQAVLNLLLNALQALADRHGGRIEVTTSRPSSGRVKLVVRDNGPGIAPSVLPRVFDPFFSTKDPGKGAGLGLAIAYGVVREHQGTIAADNHPDGGAMLVVELPTTRPAPARRTSAARRPKASRRAPAGRSRGTRHGR
jgi:PAS domain S-box-containing protein